MFILENVPYVEFVALNSYEVTFYITKPKRVRTQETIKAQSSSDARSLIYDRYGKENVQIVQVKKIN